MKGMTQFEKVDFAAFAADKDLTVTSIKSWLDYETKKPLGTAVEVAITRDDTQYKPGKDGAQVSNLYEKFAIKVPASSVSIKIGDKVTAINPVAAIYGEYRNKLSVKADDIVKVTTQATQGGTK